MATAKRKGRITLNLNEKEAKFLVSLLGHHVCGKGTHEGDVIFGALDDLGIQTADPRIFTGKVELINQEQA